MNFHSSVDENFGIAHILHLYGMITNTAILQKLEAYPPLI